MPADFVPGRESELVTFSTNLNVRINALTTAIGLTVAQCTNYTVLHDAWIASYNLVNGGDNSTPNVVAKNQAKVNLISGTGGIRDLVRIIQAYPGTTDEQRALLLITIADTDPTPVPPPNHAPSVEIAGVNGRLVTGRLHDTTEPANRGKPAGCAGAIIYSHIGATQPATIEDWKIEGITTRTKFSVMFPASTPAGAQVWVTAAWRNFTDEVGPAGVGQTVNLGSGNVQAA